jgi:hypothetical protein
MMTTQSPISRILTEFGKKAAFHAVTNQVGSKDLYVPTPHVTETAESLYRLLEDKLIGKDGKVARNDIPGYPSYDLTESYRNEFRAEQRTKLKQLFGMEE